MSLGDQARLHRYPGSTDYRVRQFNNHAALLIVGSKRFSILAFVIRPFTVNPVNLNCSVCHSAAYLNCPVFRNGVYLNCFILVCCCSRDTNSYHQCCSYSH